VEGEEQKRIGQKNLKKKYIIRVPARRRRRAGRPTVAGTPSGKKAFRPERKRENREAGEHEGGRERMKE